MENEYDLNDLKINFIIRNNYIFVENGENTLVFLVFYNKFKHKTDVLFKEILSGKMDVENIKIIRPIIEKLQDIVDNYERV